MRLSSWSLRTRYARRVHLYAAFLGGELAPGRMGEDHEVVFVVADDEVSARRAAKKKWGGDGQPHVDALTRIDKVDGMMKAAPTPISPRHATSCQMVCDDAASRHATR